MTHVHLTCAHAPRLRLPVKVTLGLPAIELDKPADDSREPDSPPRGYAATSDRSGCRVVWACRVSVGVLGGAAEVPAAGRRGPPEPAAGSGLF